mgnify:CR=1 FL=1|eukprot:scaffold22778_cov36-Tisochrysis_lutea.AAC.2
MRRCDGGSWRCMWCSAKASETSGKGPGPDGPGTLCSACSGRYRSGHTGPPQQDEEGRCIALPTKIGIYACSAKHMCCM